MTDNPYESPSAKEQVAPKVKPPSWTVPSLPVLFGVGALAAITGFAFYYIFVGSWLRWLPDKFLVMLVVLCPAVAVLLMSFASALQVVMHSDSRIVRAARRKRGFGLFGVSLLVAVAGYIAFATTCCCVNGIAAGETYNPPPRFGGITSFVSVLIGALIVFALHNGSRKIW